VKFNTPNIIEMMKNEGVVNEVSYLNF